MIHFLNQAIEMKAAAMLREFISSEEHDIGGTPNMGQIQTEHPLLKRWIRDRHLEESFVKSD
jgi:hypothetical protein